MQRASSSVTRRIWAGRDAEHRRVVGHVRDDDRAHRDGGARPDADVVPDRRPTHRLLPDRGPAADDHPGARWLNAPTRTSCSTITPELTIASLDDRAGIHDGPASTTPPGSTRALGEPGRWGG